MEIHSFQNDRISTTFHFLPRRRAHRVFVRREFRRKCDGLTVAFPRTCLSGG